MSYPQTNLDLTYSSTTASEFPDLGDNIVENGKKYACVYNAGADAIALGDIVGVYKTTPVHGHVSVTAATMLDNGTAGVFAGVGIGAIAAGSYGLIQVAGYCANATTDAGVAAGDSCVMDGGTTVGKVLDTMADGEEECVCFVADAADVSTAVTGYLKNSVLAA